MTDPRYLVPLYLVPLYLLPPVAYMCTECGDTLSEPVCLDCKRHRLYNGAPVPCLDLSPPDVVDGVPVRLDALGWALAVLARWYGVRVGLDLGDIAPVISRGSTSWRLEPFAGPHSIALRPTDPGHEEFDDFDSDQKRRIVAAILRKGRPGVAP